MNNTPKESECHLTLVHTGNTQTSKNKNQQLEYHIKEHREYVKHEISWGLNMDQPDQSNIWPEENMKEPEYNNSSDTHVQQQSQ